MIVLLILLYLLHSFLVLIEKYLVDFIQFLVKVYLHSCLQSGLSDNFLKVLVVKVLSLQIAVGGNGTRGGRYYYVLRTLKIFGDLVEEGLP